MPSDVNVHVQYKSEMAQYPDQVIMFLMFT